MSLQIAATVFILIVPAELPDKTFVASLVLATRFRALPVLIGAALGFAVQAGIAVAAGSLIALLPSAPVKAVTRRDLRARRGADAALQQGHDEPRKRRLRGRDRRGPGRAEHRFG